MALLPLFLSGAAGLLYQVAWTRSLIGVTSATATAQAFVLAVFMLGLGLGAWLAGRLVDRLRRPLLAYAAVELVAAGCAAVSLPLIRGPMSCATPS
jgi:spermidine synthase